MELKKAIEILDDCMSEINKILYPECLEAHKLGIEALNRIRECRLADYMIREDLLPGETPLPPLYSLGFNTGDDESP